MRVILPSALLVAGNLLGVGILALPVKVGLSGFLPSILAIVVICLVMLVSAFVIAARIPAGNKNFDIPSFFQQELGEVGYWIATLCNLILLYGVLVVYLSAISDITVNLFPVHIAHIYITILYFLLATSLIMLGRNVLKRGNMVLLSAIFICFLVLVKSGMADFNAHLLNYSNWKFFPLGLPVIVSAFHFHNIIPTISHHVNYDLKAVRKAITIGVAIGFFMNLMWATVVLGTLLPVKGDNSILATFLYGLPATIPMTHLLHSKVFATASLTFAALAITASYVANGTGLFGFIKDMTFTYFKIDNKILVGGLAFILPLVITIFYPQIFLSAVDIVGGIGEAILFIVLPGIILIKISKERAASLTIAGYIMLLIGLFIFLFIMGEKLGIIHYGFMIRR